MGLRVTGPRCPLLLVGLQDAHSLDLWSSRLANQGDEEETLENHLKQKKMSETCLRLKTSRFAGDWEPVTDSKAKLVLPLFTKHL